jgi:hypothetical protein
MAHMMEEPDEGDEAAEFLRYEQERQVRINRRNAASWKVVGAVVTAALALLAYDSGHAALKAHRDGEPWLYPAGIATGCTLMVLVLIAYALKRRRP